MIDSTVVIAPMAGGPSTVELAAVAAGAGAFPFLAGGYLAADRLADDITALRRRTDRPFGVNLFVPSPPDPAADEAALEYAARLAPWAEVAGVELGHARWDDDDYAAKVDVVVRERPAVVSFTFGWPEAQDVHRLRDAGVEVWCTLNQAEEVRWAEELGADAVVAQGWQAGGHRGGPVDTGVHQLDTAALVSEIRSLTTLPIVAAGGVAGGRDVETLLADGAAAVAVGTLVLRSDEAGTSDVHRDALATRSGTVVTRAFTGRSARALTTSWTELVPRDLGAAYPHVHFLTQPLRAHGKQTGNAELVHLWAGEAHAAAPTGSVADIVRDLLGLTG